MKELNLSEVSMVSAGSDIFATGGAGGALGGLLSTGTVAGAAAGSVLGLAAAASFAIGYAAGSYIVDNSELDEFLGGLAFRLFHE